MIEKSFLNRKYTGILLVFYLLSLPAVYTQITITRDDMPDVGDTVRLSSTITTGGVNYSLTGEDYLWDFSTLVPVIQQIDTFVSVSSTPFIYRLVFTSSVATIARPEPDVDFIPDYSVTDVFTYFKETDNEFHEAGVAFTLSGIPLPVKYDEPDVLYRFPMSYGNIDSCEASVELEFPDIFYFSMDKKRKNTVDGWGTLVTPYGSYSTLRIKSEVNETDSLYIDSLNTGYKIPRSYIQYKWFGNGFGLPLLQIDEEGLLLTVTYIDSLRILTSITEPPVSSDNIRIYPNPSSSVITVEWKSPDKTDATVIVCTSEGRELYRKQKRCSGSGITKETIPLEGMNLTSGTYLVCLLFNDTFPVIKKFVYQQP